MRTLATIISLWITTTIFSWADDAQNPPFQVGEKLTYQIYWGPLVVGSASLEVRGIEKVDGHDCYHLVATARTTGLGEALFSVKNKIESWLDVEGLFTRRFVQSRHEGDNDRKDETTYDYDQKQAVTRNLENGRERRMSLDQPVQDVISSIYYVRTQPLSLDAKQTFMLNASQANHTVTVSPDQQRKLSLAPTGEINALRLEPKPTLSIVSANNGRMFFWISADSRRLPLIVVSDMKIGSARLVLSKIESSAS